MSALDQVKAHGRRGETHTIEVPEWEGMVIHYHRPTLDNAAHALEAAPRNQIRQNVDMFCQLACDAAGKPIFKRIDALELMAEADPQVLGRLMREMGIIGSETPEDIEKN